MIEKTNSSGTWTYTYDNQNHLHTIWETSGGSTTLRVTYSYDVYGQRIEQQEWTSGPGTVTTEFVWSGTQVIMDLNGSNVVQERYLWGDTQDQLFARIDGNGTASWYLTDAEGSVRDVVNASGVSQDHVDYSAYGVIIGSESNAAARGRYGWTSREYDADTGLQYNMARDFSPATGTWTSQDPIGFAAGDANLYRYAKNSPVDLSDPSGLDAYSGPGSSKQTPVIIMPNGRGEIPLSGVKVFLPLPCWGPNTWVQLGDGGPVYQVKDLVGPNPPVQFPYLRPIPAPPPRAGVNDSNGGPPQAPQWGKPEPTPTPPGPDGVKLGPPQPLDPAKPPMSPPPGPGVHVPDPDSRPPSPPKPPVPPRQPPSGQFQPDAGSAKGPGDFGQGKGPGNTNTPPGEAKGPPTPPGAPKGPGSDSAGSTGDGKGPGRPEPPRPPHDPG